MEAHNKREHLRHLVQGKSQWSRSLTPEEKALGFLGWHERGYLPHCDFPNLVQLVTFRLADSLPQSRLSEWRHLIEIEDHREKRARLEAYLDRGYGACHLRMERVARLVEQALLHFHRDRYELRAWCVMPNHVHVLVEVWQIPLSLLIRSWKQFVQTQANTGAHPVQLHWQRDYWDTYMRSEDQEKKAIDYTENNPVKTTLCPDPKAWPFSSARFRDKYHRLTLPI